MTVQFFAFDERGDLVSRYSDEAEEIWPPEMQFVHHDPVCEEYWPRLKAVFPDFQFLACDNSEQQFLAVGNTVPLAWSGQDAMLPDGVPEVLRRAFAEHERGVRPTALCAILAGIQPSARSKGLSTEVLIQMKTVAQSHDLEWLIAPVRPSRKSSYPLTPIERYALWRRPDGQLFDPWLRTHERLGARLAGIAPQGNVFRGTVAEWEQWTGLAFPESGQYIVAGALEPLRIDCDRGEGVLIEQNVWMVHPVGHDSVQNRDDPSTPF
ncbi:MAG TPA: GNAT family N-acetyltransferase [Acidimicrobiia bacterium]|nr:GNAT family N-acetyltransferase [Acidimicrobiia bacterium]